MPPFLTGGSMIEIVTMEVEHLPAARRSVSRPGRLPVAQAVGLAAAVRATSTTSGWTASPRTSTP